MRISLLRYNAMHPCGCAGADLEVPDKMCAGADVCLQEQLAGMAPLSSEKLCKTDEDC